MRITQGAFSFLPDLTDEQIEAQLRYALGNGWAIMVEHTDDPHPRNSLWEMWGQPLFDLGEHEVDVALRELRAAREACPHEYVKVVCYDALARAPDDGAVVHRRPAAVRAGLPARAPGEGRPPDPLHAALLRHRRAGRACATVMSAAQTLVARPAARAAPADDIEAVLAQLDARARRAGAGQAADPRDRRAAGDRPAPARRGAGLLAPVAAHELHRQPGHRQDDGRAADGGDPPSPRLHREAEGRLGHARRPRRPVRRPHRAEDARGAQARPRRRAVHRRGLLPLPPGERARLRAGGDRDPAPGDGVRAREPRRRARRLPRPHGDLLPLQPRHGIARRAPHPLPRLRRRRADGDRAR